MGGALTSGKNISFSLTDLGDNADLYLVDSSGYFVMSSSTNGGTAPDVITRYLSAGTYYLEIVAQGYANTRYSLNIG